MSFIKLNVTDKKCSTIYMSNEEPKLLKSKKKNKNCKGVPKCNRYYYYSNCRDNNTVSIHNNVTNGTTVKSC